MRRGEGMIYGMIVAAAMLVGGGRAFGYLVGPAMSLEEMAEEADLVFKGTVTGAKAVERKAGPPGEPGAWSGNRETSFEVVSVIKGDWEGRELVFRHRAVPPGMADRRFQSQGGQYHSFTEGRTYLVFAKKMEGEGTFRQLWNNHRGKEDQGTIRCADNKVVNANGLREIVWRELLAMTRSKEPDDVGYGIRQLDDMSVGKGQFDGTADFERPKVMEVVAKLMGHHERKVAQRAIAMIGFGSPYLSDEQGLFWLAAMRNGTESPRVASGRQETTNPGGAKYWKELVAIADEATDDTVRCGAIRALGLVGYPALRPALDRWLADPSQEAHAAAVLLLADFPGPETRRQLQALAGSEAPEVRIAVGRAAGHLQDPELAGVLATMLAAPERLVRQVAARSLLSFSPEDPAIAKVFRANLENREFAPLFLNKLARENVEAYLEPLAKVVEENTRPKNWWGGRTPPFVSWELLFKYLQAQAREDVRAGKFDRYLDAMEKGNASSSSEPRDIYAFYVQRGMTGRAARFRAAMNKKATYDLDYYFKMVDENPENFQRR